MTEKVHHRPELLSLVEQEGGEGMPKVVQTDPLEAGS